MCERGRGGPRLVGSWLLTSGQAAVGATQIDVAVRDGRHAELVVGAGEKGSKSACKHNVPLTGSATHRHADLGKEQIFFFIRSTYILTS